MLANLYTPLLFKQFFYIFLIEVQSQEPNFICIQNELALGDGVISKSEIFNVPNRMG